VRALFLAGFLLASAASVPFSARATQPVEPLRPKEQQRIEILRPQGSQGMAEVPIASQQQVELPEPVSPARHAASVGGKIILGIVAAGIALGGAVVSLLFL
jgi:hypothetical protein